jgi:hypothetical protein
MSSTTRKALAFVLPVIIVAAIALAVKRSHVRRDPASWFSYTAYGIDEEGTIYVFKYDGPGLAWPVTYRGHSLSPLYGCSDCKTLFAGNPRGVTMMCPECHGHNVGTYDPETHGEVEAERVDSKELVLPST